MIAPTLPLTVIGGYLGVGKTTLINRLLADRGDQRTAVLVNDFGELDIDAQLIAQADATTIALTNGCVCCAIGDDLGAALATLQEQSAHFDQVLLEASGVADPVKLGQMAETWPGYRLQGVVVVADAARSQTLVRDRYVGAHVRKQLVDADLLLTTKLDQLDTAQREVFLDWLAEQSSAPVRRAEGFAPADIRRSIGPASAPAALHPGFQTRSFRTEVPVDRHSFERWGHTIAGQGIRGKGFLRFTDDTTTWLAQIVDGVVTLTPAAQPRGASELVLIAPSFEGLAAPFSEPPLRSTAENPAGDR